MIFAKNTTYGLETTVKSCQEFLDEELSKLWIGVIEIYGLVYQKQKDDIVVPEAYKGTGISNNEYTEVFINDKVSASVGFIIQERSLTPYRSANVDVVFTVQIPKIYFESALREKEKALLEAEKILETFIGIDNVLGVKEGVLDVFSDFNTDRIKYRDMHPWYVFSLNVDLTYTDDSCQ